MSKDPEKLPCESVQVPSHVSYVLPDLPLPQSKIWIIEIEEPIWHPQLEDYFTEKYRD